MKIDRSGSPNKRVAMKYVARVDVLIVVLPVLEAGS
jgi:hypothetical protein